MKRTSLITAAILLISMAAFGKPDSSSARHQDIPVPILTIEPGYGIIPTHLSNLRFSNILQWNILKRLSLTSYSAVTINNAFHREQYFVKTDFSYSLNQKIGIGTSAFTPRTIHTFSVMAGLKYDAHQETLRNPDYEKVTATTRAISPDFGLLYSLKAGKKSCFFSYRMYVPLYPYPIKGANIHSITGNLAELSLEVGVGFRLK